MQRDTWYRSVTLRSAAFSLLLAAPAFAQTPAAGAPASSVAATSAAEGQPASQGAQIVAEAGSVAAIPAAPAPEARPRVLPSSAAAYADYQADVSTIGTKPLAGAKDLDQALEAFGARNPEQLSGGWISYAALIASQNKQFAETVQDIDGHYGRQRMVTGLQNSVSWARTLDGGQAALQTALAANAKDTTRISSAGAFVKQQSYALGKVKWGKTVVKDTVGAANKLKLTAKTTRPIAEAAQKMFAAPDMPAVLASSAASEGSVWDRVATLTASAPIAALNTGLTEAQPAAATAGFQVTPKFEGTANRIVTLAALHVLEAEEGHEDSVRAAIRDRTMTECIESAELQLQACVSAAGTRAEQSFCLAQHALGLEEENKPAVGACFKKVAK